jgi:hypothetical protein
MADGPSVLARPRRRKVVGLALTGGVVLAMCVASLAIGTEHVSLPVVWQAVTNYHDVGNQWVVRELRVPRTALALVVGVAPGLSGAVIQAVARNPLAANDPRRSVFTALGVGTQDVSGDLSEEKLKLLDRDVLFVNGASKEQMLESPAFSRLKVVRDGRTLYTSFDSNLSGAMTYGGPDALRYALDKLVPQLGNALNGRPVADLANA